MISTSFFGVLTKFRALSCLHLRTFSSVQPKLSMNTIYFRHQSDEKQFQVMFRYINEGFGIDRHFNLLRNEAETVDVCLKRIGNNLEKEFMKKIKKQNKKQNKKQKKNKVTGSQQNDEKTQDSALVCLRKDSHCSR